MKRFLLCALSALFLIACGGGDTTENIAEYNKAKNSAKDYEEKLKIAVDYCDDGLKDACSDASTILSTGPSKLKDFNKSLQYSLKACELKHPLECFSLGAAYLSPMDKRDAVMKEFPIEYDIQKGIMYLEKSCEYDDNFCFNLFKLYTGNNPDFIKLIGKEQAQSLVNYDKAESTLIKYYERVQGGCDGHCSLSLAEFYLKFPKDTAKAEEHALKACEASSDQCYGLSKLFEQLKDVNTARNLLLNGCGKGDLTSCRVYEQKYKK